jgi:DNA polymerase-1
MSATSPNLTVIRENSKKGQSFIIPRNTFARGLLKEVCKSYLGVELDKQWQCSDWSQELISSQLEYAAILLTLRETLKAKLIEADLAQVAKIEFDCIPAVAAMELDGMLLDEVQWQQLALKMEVNTQKSALELTELIQKELSTPLNLLTGKAPKIDINSPTQVLNALQAMGIAVNSTAKKEIAPLASQYRVINSLIEYRHWSKAKTSFGSTLPKHISNKTNKIHSHYEQLGAVSGRFSCSNPNLQQIPRQKEVRQCFIASPGSNLVMADYSQIELRIVAEISGDSTMIQAYQQGQDLHKLTASLVLGKPLEALTSEDRQLAKAINFGLIYGISAAGLLEYAFSNYGVNMTLPQAQQFREKYLSGYSGLASWQKQQAKLLYQKGMRETRTLANRRRQWSDKPRLTEMLNTPVQGTSADITKLALANLLPALVDTGAKIIGVIHDEIILESPQSTKETVAQILVQVMQAAGKQFLRQVPVEVEAYFGQSWGEKK